MSVKFEVEVKGFENALVRYKLACQKDWQFVIKQQGRLIGEKLIKFTPPKSVSTGKKNVASDIGKVFADLGNTRWEDKSLNKMWRAGNFDGIKKALENHPDKESLPIFKYERIFQKPIRNIHKKAIGKRGRVPNKWQTRYAVAGRGEHKKYVKIFQDHVGVARSGWLSGVQKLGGKAPTWVSKHGTRFGDFVDRNYGDSPFIEIINRVRTFPQGSMPMKIMTRALRAQRMAMENNIKRLLRQKKL